MSKWETKIRDHVASMAEMLKDAPKDEHEWLWDVYIDGVSRHMIAGEQGSPSPKSIKELVGGYWGELKQTHGNELLGLASGFQKLDGYINGWRGLTLLGAEPNIGKTTLLQNIGNGIVEKNPDAIFVMFSFEMAVKEIFWRNVSAHSKLPYSVLRLGSTGVDGKRRKLDERIGHAWDEADAKAAASAETALRVDPRYERIFVLGPESVGSMSLKSHDGTSKYPLWPMEQAVLRCMRATGATHAFIGIDYLQRIPVDQSAARSDLDRDERTMEAVHTLQRRLNQPVLAIAEFRKDDIERAHHGSKTSSMTAFAGSRRLAYSADALISMTAPKDTSASDDNDVSRNNRKVLQKEVTIEVLKVRDGGTRGKVDFMFELEASRFKEKR